MTLERSAAVLLQSRAAPPDAAVGWPQFFIRVYERRPPAASDG